MAKRGEQLPTAIQYEIIDFTIKALISGNHRRDIVKYIKEKYNVSETTADNYIARAKVKIHEMANENIYYINIKPYYYDLKFNEMIQKFMNSDCGKKMINDYDNFEKIMNDEFKRYNYKCLDKNLKEYEIDKVLGKQIMTHLQEFFNKPSKNKTHRNIIKKNRTRRKY